jgi:hypothetical protein
MSDIATVGQAAKAYLVDQLTFLFSEDSHTRDVLVTFGTPANLEVDDIVSILAVRSTQEVAAMGARRSRNELLEIEVSISCFRGGGQEMERVSSDRAFELLRMVENYCRATDTTLGGLVNYCFLTSYDCDGTTPPAYLDRGRVTEILARFGASARITT